MLISTEIGSLSKIFGEIESLRIVSEAGFDAYDLSLNELSRDENYFLNGDDYIEKAKKLKNYADSIGLVCNQSHAPFPTSKGDPEYDKWIFEKVVRAMEIASICGAKIIIVHPNQHLNHAECGEELFKLNVDFYNRLIPYAKKFGIKIAVENMWQRNKGSGAITDSTCSRAWEFCKYIDAINSEWVVGCLDIGHASLMGADLPAFIKTMGNKRLKALHVHDNDFINDSHTAPFFGKIDFESVCKALKEIGYSGDLTFETYNYFKKFPKDFCLNSTKFLYDIGRKLIKTIEE